MNGYATNDKGEQIFVGRYTLAIRDHYIAYRVGRYLIDHQKDNATNARKYAKVAWRRKAERSMGIHKGRLNHAARA